MHLILTVYNLLLKNVSCGYGLNMNKPFVCGAVHLSWWTRSPYVQTVDMCYRYSTGAECRKTPRVCCGRDRDAPSDQEADHRADARGRWHSRGEAWRDPRSKTPCTSDKFWQLRPPCMCHIWSALGPYFLPRRPPLRAQRSLPWLYKRPPRRWEPCSSSARVCCWTACGSEDKTSTLSCRSMSLRDSWRRNCVHRSNSPGSRINPSRCCMSNRPRDSVKTSFRPWWDRWNTAALWRKRNETGWMRKRNLRGYSRRAQWATNHSTVYFDKQNYNPITTASFGVVWSWGLFSFSPGSRARLWRCLHVLSENSHFNPEVTEVWI